MSVYVIRYSIKPPGDVILSHNGVLFFDELPESLRQVLEVLLQPLEDSQVTIFRVNASLSYPAKFMLVAAMKPCPCGFLSDPGRQCTCTPTEIHRYAKKISGPLLDRIDLHVHIPRSEYKEMPALAPAESSSSIRARGQSRRDAAPAFRYIQTTKTTIRE